MSELLSTQDALARGPDVFENWKAALAGMPSLGASEYLLFTDAHITGHIGEGFGPYQFHNTVPIDNLDKVQPSIVLRMEHHLKYDVSQINYEKTDDERYHGGYINDEIAALVSICLGIR